MPSGPVILNNTPLVAFWLLGQFDLLQRLYGEVLIPDAVLAEFTAFEPFQRRQALSHAPWIVSTSLSNPQSALVYAGLDRGESEVLALAIERQARLVILDERKARSFAHRIGLPLTGTLGVLLAAKQRGVIVAVKPLVNSLEGAGLHFHPALLSTVLAQANE